MEKEDFLENLHFLSNQKTFFLTACVCWIFFFRMLAVNSVSDFCFFNLLCHYYSFYFIVVVFLVVVVEKFSGPISAAIVSQ